MSNREKNAIDLAFQYEVYIRALRNFLLDSQDRINNTRDENHKIKALNDSIQKVTDNIVGLLEKSKGIFYSVETKENLKEAIKIIEDFQEQFEKEYKKKGDKNENL